MSGGTFTAHLSDLSAADFTDSTTPTGGQYDRNYTLTYKAASAGQTLTVSWVTTSGAGNVTLNGAALTGGAPAPGSPTIAATAGTPQSTAVLTSFGTALQSTVKDASNNPISGATVTFTAPSSGASASFSGSATTTAITNASGVATAPALTANGQTGTYAVTASAAGASAPATFNLTNLAGAPASIAATAGTPQSATVLTNFGTALQVTVKDAGNNLLSGISVTFTAPSSGAGASFGGSSTPVSTATANTNTAGVATAPALTANNAIGSYTVTATVAGSSASASFALTNTAPLASGGGALTGSGTSAAATANLTTEGTSDWVHWGNNSPTRKNGVTPQIGNYTLVGSGTVFTYNNDPRALTWTDGTPTASATNNNGIYVNYLQNGYSFTAPADTGTRTLSVYVGGWLSGGTLTAHLSDFFRGGFCGQHNTGQWPVRPELHPHLQSGFGRTDTHRELDSDFGSGQRNTERCCARGRNVRAGKSGQYHRHGRNAAERDCAYQFRYCITGHGERCKQ